MEIKSEKEQLKLERAKKRIKDLKGYYGHLVAYLGVNTMLTVVKVVSELNNGRSFIDAFFEFNTFSIWFFWGIGMFFHTLKVFSLNPLFGKDWEERQIQKYMDQDKKESQKYR